MTRFQLAVLIAVTMSVAGVLVGYGLAWCLR